MALTAAFSTNHPTMPGAARGIWMKGDVPLARNGTPLSPPVFYNIAPVSQQPTVYRDKGSFWLRYHWKRPNQKGVRRSHHERYESKQAAESWRLPLMRFLNGPRRKEPKKRVEGMKRKNGGGQVNTHKKRKLATAGPGGSSNLNAHKRLESRTIKYRKRLSECEIQIEYLKDRLRRGSALELVRPMEVDSVASNQQTDGPSIDSGNGEESVSDEESGSEEEQEDDGGEQEEDGDGGASLADIEELEEGNAEVPQFSEKDIQRATLQANAVLIVYCFIQQDILEAIDGERKRSPVKTMVQKAAALTAASWFTVYRCVCIAVVSVLSAPASHDSVGMPLANYWLPQLVSEF